MQFLHMLQYVNRLRSHVNLKLLVDLNDTWYRGCLLEVTAVVQPRSTVCVFRVQYTLQCSLL